MTDLLSTPLTAFGQSLGSMWEQIAEAQRSQMRLLIERAAEIHRQAMQQVVERIGEAFARTEAAVSLLEPEALQLGERGWTMPMWAPLFLAHDLIEKVPADELDDVFLRAYASERGKKEKETFGRIQASRQLQQWHPLIEQSIKGYKRGDYLLVVPALLIIFEGAIAASAEKSLENADPKRTTASQVAAADRGTIRVAWVSLQGFASLVFQFHKFSDTPPSYLNRHWVLHGRDTRKWERVDCLRLFQALDTLAVITRRDQ